MWRTLCTLVCLVASAAALAALPQHRLQVRLDPARHGLEARDRLQLSGPVTFHLHRALTVTAAGGRLEALEESHGAVPLRRYRLTPTAPTVTLRWQGVIHHPVRRFGDRLRGQAESPGYIGPEGVFLDAGSGWYPRIDGWDRFTFELQVTAPPDWWLLTQGAAPSAGPWRVETPQEDVVLVGGPLHRHLQRSEAGTLAVFLRRPDPELAAAYLAASARHLDFYRRLLGPYPYPGFAVVENFWESGYGFPGFTLLGPRVLRLPFIPHTALPHEVLHNWWGNGVYVDWRRGNWSEGLTAYLADHLMKERQGRGAEYRRATLRKYRDYAAHGRDFPLRRFQARHSGASEAVGYGKALMVFHMLRRTLGDAPFLEGLRRFYGEWRFREAAWEDLQASFEAVSGRSLEAFFAAWLERSGAPRLRPVALRPEADGTVLVVLRQTGPGAPYPLHVPLAFTLAGRDRAWETTVFLEGTEGRFRLRPPAPVLRLDVDPRFDLFRYLDDSEIPPALGQFFGAARRLVVVPAGRSAYEAAARAWSEPGVAHEVVEAADLRRLPADRPVWLWGWDTPFLPALRAALAAQGVTWEEDGVRLLGRRFARSGHCLVLALPGPNPQAPRFWADCDRPEALPVLARKLPHYGRYGALVFTSDAAVLNRFKAEWPSGDSVMTLVVGEARVAAAPLPPRPSLDAAAR